MDCDTTVEFASSRIVHYVILLLSVVISISRIMSIPVMWCGLQGFPYGTKPGEEERVSLPNAKYTQGNYKAGVYLAYI